MGLVIDGSPRGTGYRTEIIEQQTFQWSKLVGVLFCMPSSQPGKEEILPGLDFHYRSGFFVDFFCIGYGPASLPQPGLIPTPGVATVKSVEWFFNASEFNACRADFESATKWRYSGETDLLLVVARKPQDGGLVQLDYSCALACNPEAMKRDGAITSVRAFFEAIFRFGEKCKDDDPVWALSDKFGIAAGGGALQEGLLSLLPETVAKQYKSIRHLAVTDISI